jgi:hypothetical protein
MTPLSWQPPHSIDIPVTVSRYRTMTLSPSTRPFGTGQIKEPPSLTLPFGTMRQVYRPTWTPTLPLTSGAGARQFIQPAFRGTEGQKPFSPEKPAPDGASAADHLAAFLGRTV